MHLWACLLLSLPLLGRARAQQDSSEYKFRYRVTDASQGQDFGQEEEKEGDNLGGEYQVLLPDGRTQVVSYKASEPAGFLARVEYQGEVTLPDDPVQYLRTPKRLRPAVESLLLANRASLPKVVVANRAEHPVVEVVDRKPLLTTLVGERNTIPFSLVARKDKGYNANGYINKGANIKYKQMKTQPVAPKPFKQQVKKIVPFTETTTEVLKLTLATEESSRTENTYTTQTTEASSSTTTSTEANDSPVFKTNTESPKMTYKDSDFKASATRVLNSLFREDVLEKDLKIRRK